MTIIQLALVIANINVLVIVNISDTIVSITYYINSRDNVSMEIARRSLIL